jgi:parallel beta-helix repeat protein
MARYKVLSAAIAAAALLIVTASTVEAKVINVKPGDSIQAAVDQASPGDTVQVAPGTYTEAGQPCPVEPASTCAVVIDKNDISLIAKVSGGKSVTLQAASGQDVGIGVGKTDDPSCLTDASLQVRGSLLQGLTVQGFADDGVLLFCVDGWRISDLVARDNHEYAIFPSHSFNGRLDHSFASGAHDTGFYIGQSYNARMDHNLATQNVSGYEIENSIGVTADYNVAHDNTGGILSFTLPFLDVKENHDNVIEHNVVHHNNAPNECSGGTVCEVPSGTGILVLAADSNEVRENLVTDNRSFGIAVSNICVAQQLPPDVCAALDIEPNPDDNRITSNAVLGNGTNPDPILPAVFAVDLAWDTTGTGNCWSNNVFGTSFPDPLPSC